MDFSLNPDQAEHNTAVRKLLINIQVLQSNEQKRNFLKLQYKMGQGAEKQVAYTAYLEQFHLHGKQQQARAFLDSPI